MAKIVHAAKMPWGESLTAHRQGTMAHKVLFEGTENTPDNFVWTMAREGADYFSPRHRHNWDQVRLCIEGAIPISKGLKIEAGEVGYFPEGVPYGPQEGGPDRITLVFQGGGASAQGYMSAAQTRRGREELLQLGKFEGGVFHRERGDGRKTQDAYEAIWQHVFGAPIAYPPPRYHAPIIMRPEGFSWRRLGDGIDRKALGQFPEPGLSLDFFRLDAGVSDTLAPSDKRRLIFVCDGNGTCDGETYATHSAVRLEPGESITLKPQTATTVFVISLPMIGRI